MESTDSPKLGPVSRLLSVLQRRALARSALYAFLIYTLSAGLGYFFQTFLARVMTIEGYGLYTYINTWSEILAIPAGLGFASAALRFIPQYKSQGDAARLRAFARTACLLTLAASFVIATAFLWAALAQGAAPRNAWILGAALLPLHALVALWMQMSRADGRVVLALGPPMVLRHVLLFAGTLLLLVLGGNPGPTEMLWLLFGVIGTNVLVMGTVLYRDSRRWGAAEHPAALERGWFAVAIPLLFATLFQLVVGRADILMLGAFWGTESVALYNAASKSASLSSFVLLAISMVMAPKVSTLYTQGDQAGLQRMATLSTGIMFSFSLIICAGLLLLGRPILGFFGSQYVAVYPALGVLLIGHLSASAFGIVVNLLAMTGHQMACLRVYAGTALLNVGLNFVVIPHYGILGAAICTTATMALTNVLLYLQVRRRVGIDTAFWRFHFRRFL